MQLAVITVARTPSYLGKTLASLRLTAPGSMAGLFVGNLDLRDVEPYADDERYEIYPMRAEQWHRIEPLKSYQRACANFVNALVSYADRPVLLLEDDITFKPGWFDTLMRAIDRYPEALISLYVSPFIVEHGVLRDPPDDEFAVIPPMPTIHYGSLALYVPTQWRSRLARFIVDRFGPTVDPFDTMVNSFVDQYRPTFVTTTASWVDHLGEVSAIDENRDHGPRRSPRW